MSEEKEMSFIDHLEELRMHIIRSLIAVLGAGIVLFVAKDFVFHTLLFGPVRPDFPTYQLLCWISNSIGIGDALCYDPSNIKLMTLKLGEAFLLHIKVSFIAGFVFAFPYVFWEFWRFLRPGLHRNERGVVRGIVFVCSTLFLMGVAFGYFVISPFAVNFLAGYQLPGVDEGGNLIQAASFINYMIMFTVPTGLVFELPIVVFYLAKVGIVTPQLMRTYRRHAIVLILVLAALITPPDVMTQFLIGIPLFILYELSIFIAAREVRRQAKYEAREERRLREMERAQQQETEE